MSSKRYLYIISIFALLLIIPIYHTMHTRYQSSRELSMINHNISSEFSLRNQSKASMSCEEINHRLAAQIDTLNKEVTTLTAIIAGKDETSLFDNSATMIGALGTIVTTIIALYEEYKKRHKKESVHD